MRQTLTIATLLFTLGLAACADHSSGMISFDSPSQPPVGPGDQGALDPGTGGATTGGNPGGNTGGGNNGGGNTGGGSPPSGSPVPEPGTMLLVGTGLAGAALLRRRRRNVVVEG
jgi:hypothetical protein